MKLQISFYHSPLNLIFQFLLTYLEPPFNHKRKSLFEYPFESSQEHFSRFENVSDTLASRIPLIYPHTDKGGT